MPDLHVDCEERGNALLIRIRGDAGVNSADALERGLTSASARHPAFAILDLSELTFISSLGMGLLVAFHRGVEQRQGNVRLAAPRPPVLDALSRAHLDRLFVIRPTLDEALKEAAAQAP